MMEDGLRLQDSVGDQPGKMQSEGGNISERALVAPEPSTPLRGCAGPQNNTKLKLEGQEQVSQLFN